MVTPTINPPQVISIFTKALLEMAGGLGSLRAAVKFDPEARLPGGYPGSYPGDYPGLPTASRGTSRNGS